jgi:hypothetical protein
MMKNIPYQSPKSEDLQLIERYLVNGILSGSDANFLIQEKGISWQKVAPHVVEDESWWLDQARPKAKPVSLNWKIMRWGSTISIEVADYHILVDPGPLSPMPETCPDLILITHAHHDHIGGLDAVVSKYSDCLVVTSGITAEFMKMRGAYNYVQSLKLMNQNDATELRGINIRTHRAGHLLGAMMFEIEIQGETALVTGDFAIRKVGDYPGFDFPNIDCSILILATTGGAGQGSLPFADLRFNHMKFLEELYDCGGDKIYIPLQSLGQTQEAYTAIALSQRAGGLSEFEVYFDESLTNITRVYERELANRDGIWLEDTPILHGVQPQNSIVIASEKPSPDTAGYTLNTPNIFTHASWGECMALATWVKSPQIYTYHGSSDSLNYVLGKMGFNMSFPDKE